MNTTSPRFRTVAGLFGLALALLTAACDDSTGPAGSERACIVPEDLLFNDGIPKDAIPALTDPALVDPADPGASYVGPGDRVVGMIADGVPVALPHKLLNWHEVVNLNLEERRLAVTFCPLTGSALAFDRSAIGGAEFGVTGFLVRSNLVMYDRTSRESLWPQMGRRAVCGPRAREGQTLEMEPVLLETTMAGWRELHPDTRVVSANTGFERTYDRNAYATYSEIDNSETGGGFGEPDPRRAPKERVLGVPHVRAGIAFPFRALDSLGPVAAVRARAEGAEGEEVVVFWDREKAAAAAFLPRTGSRSLTFEVRSGQVVDRQTESRWRVDGRATSGPLAGRSLEPVRAAYVAYWFAWAAFQPETEIWSPESPTP